MPCAAHAQSSSNGARGSQRAAQKLIDNGLQSEFTETCAAVAAIDVEAHSGTADEVLVAVRFDVQELAALRIRFEAVMVKASEVLKTSRSGDIKIITEKIAATAVLAQNIQLRYFWIAYKIPFMTIAKAIVDGKMAPDEHTKVRETQDGGWVCRDMDFFVGRLLCCCGFRWLKT